MGNDEAFHSTAACCEALHAEFGQEKQCPQHDVECVDGDPLLAQLGDVAQQGIFQQLQLAEQTLMGHLLLGLEDLVQGIDVTDPLCSPFHEVGMADTVLPWPFAETYPPISCLAAARMPCFLCAV